jgi:hypothetical protein
MLYELKNLSSRSACAENPDAIPGTGGKAGGGRKGAPCIVGFQDGSTISLLDADGPGIVRHIWCTIPPGNQVHLRNLILRIYWDNQKLPSVEVPLGDFFVAYGGQRHMSSELLSTMAGRGFNCWIPMPFRKHARITLENDSGSQVRLFFYQVSFTVGDELGADTGYFHAQFRRSNPCRIHEDYTILDGVAGKGVYLGTALGVRSLYNESWWGEGEVKFFLDGEEFPTICGTGTEDYIGQAWGLTEVCAPWQGCPLADDKAGFYSFYRFHGKDPIYFNESLKVTIQQIGYGSGIKAAVFYGKEFKRYPAAGNPEDSEFCYYDRSDDYSSVAYWYQTLPSLALAKLPDRQNRSADLPTFPDSAGRGHVFG